MAMQFILETFDAVGFVFYLRDNLVADCAADGGYFLDGYIDIIKDSDFIADIYIAFDVGNIYHCQVHADCSGNGSALSVYGKTPVFFIFWIKQFPADAV
jgi:hypothetical protein